MLRQHSLGHMIERHGSPIRRVRSISTRAAQWSPGLRERDKGIWQQHGELGYSRYIVQYSLPGPAFKVNMIHDTVP